MFPGVETEKFLFFKPNAEIPSKSTAGDKTMLIPEKFFIYLTIKNSSFSISLFFKTITRLDISYCNLEYVPANCCVLNLKHLNLAHNRFEQVPACLYSGLRFLESLDLSYNRISLFDREPDCIKHLKIVNLSNNLFRNVPNWFLTFRAVSLEEFIYSNNKANHYNYLKNSYNCSINKLLKLELRNCLLIDSDYGFLRLFKRLTYLDIGNEGNKNVNKFHELDDVFVKLQWKDLTILKANNLGIATFPIGIFWLETLVEVYLRGNLISWISEDIQFMINLEVFEISDNYVVSLPQSLANLTNLRVLKASNNKIESVPDLSSMTALKVLDLYKNSLEEVSIEIASLEYVDLEYNFLNMKDFGIYMKYEERKSKYRQKLSLIRKDGYSSRPHNCETSFIGNNVDDEANVEYTDSAIQEPAIVDDWNVEISRPQISSDLDTDEDWNDEEQGYKRSTNCQNLEKIYVPDEDWMFEDFNENL